MLRTFAGFVLLFAVQALALPGKALAGPPEGVSGKMMFVDKVADGLRRYHQEEDEDKQLEWLDALSPTHDPRVGVVLGNLLERYEVIGVRDRQFHTIYLFTQYFSSDRPPIGMIRGDELERALRTWKARKAELYRRAKKLPQ